MATDVERLVVQMEANMRGYERSMQRAIGQTNQTARRMETRFERANQSIGRGFQAMGRVGVQALGALGVAVGGAQMARLASDALQAAESIQDMSRRANVSAEFLQEMRFAADQNGASARDLDDAVSRLNRRLGLFINDGGGPAANAFRDLGLATRITSGELNDAESVFNAAVLALEGVENAAERSALASELFGDDAGPRLVQMLSLGTVGLNEFREAARQAGLVLENELVSGGAEANAALRAMRQEMQATFNRGVLENVEGIESLAEAISGLVQGFLTAIGAAHRLGVEIRDLVGLNDLVPSETAQGFAAVAGQVRDDMTVGQLRQIITRELSSDEAGRFLESVGANGPLLNNPATGTNFRPNDDLRLADVATRSPAQIRDLLQGFADGARTQARIVDELEDIEVPDLIGNRGGGGGGGGGGSDSTGPSFGPVNANGEIIASADARLKPATGLGGMGSNPEADKAKELGLMQAQEYAREMERNQDKFSREFAYTFAGGFRAAFEGDLADFAAQRLRDALYDRLFTLFESLGRTLFNAINGEGGGGFLSSVASAAFGGGKAAGGPVRAGMAYRVGERGPETIIPAQNGMVLPNAAMAPMRGQGGGVTVVNQFHLHAEGAVMTDELLREMDAKAETAGRTAVAVSRNDLASIRKRNSRRLG